MIHEHSLQAHRQEKPRLSTRTEAVIAWIQKNGPATDREVKDGMGFSDMNSVRPRITDAIEEGNLAEVSERRCPVTKKNVRVVDLTIAARGRTWSSSG